MKIFVSALFALVMLTGCANNQPEKYNDGQVLDCSSIKKSKDVGLQLQCIGDETLTNFEALRGPMLLNVWGTWCAPCLDELPLLRRFHDQYGDRVQVVGLNVEEQDKSDVEPFIKEHGIVWPSLYDPDGRTRKVIGMGVPVTWFIDSDGTVVHKKIGAFADTAEIEELVKKYFNLP
jgi:thiol-disulfide isomerase/thioredoxin